MSQKIKEEKNSLKQLEHVHKKYQIVERKLHNKLVSMKSQIRKIRNKKADKRKLEKDNEY